MRRSMAFSRQFIFLVGNRRGLRCSVVMTAQIPSIPEPFDLPCLGNIMESISTSCQVYGKEWSYGMTFDNTWRPKLQQGRENSRTLNGDDEMVAQCLNQMNVRCALCVLPLRSGIISHEPAKNADHTFRETLSMGLEPGFPRRSSQGIPTYPPCP